MSHENIDLGQILRHKGYRLTPQRQMVLDAVCKANGHASTEQIYSQVRDRSPAVNRATVYRILRFLRELDLITATATPDGRLEYEIAGGEPHHHLVCHSCDRDIEFSNDDYMAFVARLERRHGFLVGTNHLTLSGLCASCRTEG